MGKRELIASATQNSATNAAANLKGVLLRKPWLSMQGIAGTADGVQ